MTFQMFAVYILLKRVNCKMFPSESIKFLFIGDSQSLDFQVVTHMYTFSVGTLSSHTHTQLIAYSTCDMLVFSFVLMLVNMNYFE